VYDPAFGEGVIPPGVPFADLPAEYTCSLCDAPKSEFQLIPAYSNKVPV
jgi:rubredoxin